MAKKITKKNNNLELWNKVCETNPAITKRVNTRGGFTAIDAQSQIKRATELFGMFGTTWGLSDLVYSFVFDGAANPIGIYLNATFYYIYNDLSGAFPIAADMVYKPNDDCFKKLRTECISKSLSAIGFNSDVFEGKFDDNKYVAEMSAKHKVETKPAAKPESKSNSKILQEIAEAMVDDVPDGHLIDMKLLEAAIIDEFGKLPTKKTSIPKVLEKIKAVNVMVENDFIKGLE